VLLFGLKAIPEPDVRNSKIAVPLLLYLSGHTDTGYRFFVMSLGNREPLLSKRGKTCEAVRAGKQSNHLIK